MLEAAEPTPPGKVTATYPSQSQSRIREPGTYPEEHQPTQTYSPSPPNPKSSTPKPKEPETRKTLNPKKQPADIWAAGPEVGKELLKPLGLGSGTGRRHGALSSEMASLGGLSRSSQDFFFVVGFPPLPSL